MKYKMGNSRKSSRFMDRNPYFSIFIGWDIPPKDNINEYRFKAMILDSFRRHSCILGKITDFFPIRTYINEMVSKDNTFEEICRKNTLKNINCE